jgi:hypothetical protein
MRARNSPRALAMASFSAPTMPVFGRLMMTMRESSAASFWRIGRVPSVEPSSVTIS